MTVNVCVGSSCHLKGSYKIISLLTDAVKAHGLGDKVELGAAFCLGKCTDGVSVKVDDEVVCGVCPENFDAFFAKRHCRRGRQRLAARVRHPRDGRADGKNGSGQRRALP